MFAASIGFGCVSLRTDFLKCAAARTVEDLPCPSSHLGTAQPALERQGSKTVLFLQPLGKNTFIVLFATIQSENIFYNYLCKLYDNCVQDCLA